MAGGYYPPVGFHFKVEFLNIGNDNDIRFQSVTGLSVEYDTEVFREGGENRFEHKLPVRTKYPDLSLKRGLLTDSKVIKWVKGILQDRDFSANRPCDIQISLLNEKHHPLTTWHCYNCWPKKWTISDFNAQENVVVIETLDVSYSYFKVI
jgi:phage tail-like protein